MVFLPQNVYVWDSSLLFHCTAVEWEWLFLGAYVCVHTSVRKCPCVLSISMAQWLAV